jgi:outer membrane lipase/esterase
MFKPLRKSAAALLVSGLIGLAGTAQAGPYSSMVVFGDSLSDTGNVLTLLTAFGSPFPIFPGAGGRFSNGPIWIDHLATGLGLPAGAAPANLVFNGSSVVPIGLPGGTNYAWGGARTGLGGSAGPTSGLVGQLVNWNGSAFSSSLSRAADPNALYVVVAGGNDLRDARSANPGNTAGDVAARTAAAAATAQGVANAVGLLAQAGARHFLVSNLPDLGRSPEAIVNGVEAASSDVTARFNAALAMAMGGLDAAFFGATGIDLDIRSMDLAGLSDSVFQDATTNGGQFYGISNVSTPCINPVAPGAYYFPGSDDSACGNAGFSDDLHPSAAFHRLIGQLALSTVPVPAPLALVLAGLALLAVQRRRAVRV